MQKRAASWVVLALVGLAAAFAIRARIFSRNDAPAPESSETPVAPLPPPPVVEEDASHIDTSQAVADLGEDHYIHKAFVAVGPGDVTVWKDGDGTFRTAAGTVLCEHCLTMDFVVRARSRGVTARAR